MHTNSRMRVPYIVVGSPDDSFLQVYDVLTNRWEKKPQEFICHLIPLQELVGYPAAVDNKLYWYSLGSNWIVKYDLLTKEWSLGDLPLHDNDDYTHQELNEHLTPPCLSYLGGGNKFCLIWISGSSHYYRTTRLHCMKFEVTTRTCTTTNAATGSNDLRPSYGRPGVIPLEVSILSCKSILAPGLSLFEGAMVVDGRWVARDTTAPKSDKQ